MDWIEEFLEYTEGIMSPEIFRLWTAIGIIAGAMERRCYSQTRVGTLYPNLFVLMVAPPGVGKSQTLQYADRFWRKTKNIWVAPNSMTKASMMDTLAKAERKMVLNGGAGLLQYNSLQVVAPELGVFIPSYDTEFLSALNFLWDNPDSYTEERRTNNKSLNIINPQLTLLAGTQPGFMASFLPEEAWSMGTTARFIMIYAGTAPKVPLFGDNSEDEARLKLETKLQAYVTDITKRIGRFTWTPEAITEISRWYAMGCEPAPQHSRLTHYSPRRHLQVMKLAMVSAAARRAELIIDLDDVNRARDWLLEAEALMPDIFRQMAGKSDSQVLQEMHLFAWRIYAKDKKPIHESRIITFLSSRAPSDKIHRLMEVAEKTGMISREFGTVTYTPKPVNQIGVE